jgi:hypothetical protein
MGAVDTLCQEIARYLHEYQLGVVDGRITVSSSTLAPQNTSDSKAVELEVFLRAKWNPDMQPVISRMYSTSPTRSVKLTNLENIPKVDH